MLAKEDELCKVKERQEQAEKLIQEYESKQQQVGVCLSAVVNRHLKLCFRGSCEWCVSDSAVSLC